MGHPSIFRFREYFALAGLPGVTATNFDQCRWGGETLKPTRIMAWGVDLSALALRCNHDPRLQTRTTIRGAQ
eukprot:11192449-Lingulodinium_polyedra.AAC.1